MGSYLRYGRHGVKQMLRFIDASYESVLVNPLLYAPQGLRYKRTLQVILTTDIEKLGNTGDIVKVAPGYFRNYLMPTLLAVPSNDKFAHLITEQCKFCRPTKGEEEKDVTVVKESKQDMMKEYEKAALRLDKAMLVLRRLVDVQKAKSRASKDDPLELRSPVSKEVLVAEVARQLCVNIAPENLHLPLPLSTLGEYEVPLRLPRSIPLPEGKVNWNLKVKIRGK